MAIRRNKRCLLAYHVSRLTALQKEVNTGYEHFNSAQLATVTGPKKKPPIQ
jgi:hypothetical protein